MSNQIVLLLLFMFSFTAEAQIQMKFEFVDTAGKRIKGHMNYVIEKDTLHVKTDSIGTCTLHLDSIPESISFFRDGLLANSTITNKELLQKSTHRIIFVPKIIKLPEIRYNYDKPAIYLYSDSTISLTIQLPENITLGFCHPAYNKTWDVFICENELILNSKPYPYLFWEGEGEISATQINWREGYCVARENLISFFESHLINYGLNEKESQDFITYWLPKLNKNAFNYVHFVREDIYESLAPLLVSPIPDNQLRLFMVTSKLDHPMDLIPQRTKPFKRDGFTLIEWGGAIVSPFNM